MDYQYLFPFEWNEFSFCGAHCFFTDKWSFLLSQNGSSIILQNNLVQSIENKKLSEDLAFKLYQHGFGLVYGQERFSNFCHDTRPTLFMIDFTTKCNCNCIYCLRHFEGIGNDISDDMLEKITQYIITYCKQNNIYHISFQPWGGEPLIMLDQILNCKQMFEKAQIRVDFNIQTNGLLLNLTNYEKLRKSHIAIGVSLDGIEAVHDAHRLDTSGNTTHSRVVKNIREILAKYPDANIGTLSVNSVYSFDHIEESVDYLVNEIGLHSIKFNLVHPSGTKSFDYSMLIPEKSLEKYVDKLLNAVVEQTRCGRNFREANITDKLRNLLDRSNNNICNSMGCRGGFSFISFDQKGNIYPCEMIGQPEFCLGNIEDQGDNLLDLIHRAQAHNHYYAPKKIKTCSNCPYLYFCRGGCKANCVAYGKEPFQIDHIECALNRSLYPRLIELILTEPELVERMSGLHIQRR